MVRISDGRMSGTGFGTVVLHASRKRRWEDIFRSSAMATSSNSTCPVGPWQSRCLRKNSKRENRPGGHGIKNIPAATFISTKSMLSRLPRRRHRFSERRIGQRSDAGLTLRTGCDQKAWRPSRSMCSRKPVSHSANSPSEKWPRLT